MEIMHHGMTIHLPDGDPRVRVVEALLFGGLLPPPFPMPEPPPPPTPAPVAPPPPVVPKALATLWGRLRPHERKELLLLRERVWRPDELEEELKLNKDALSGSHARMRRLANTARQGLYVLTKGKSRYSRRYMLPPSAGPLLDLLTAAGLV